MQAYEGVVIAKKNAGLNSAFTVRKISHGTGVERVFQSHSQIIDSVVVKRRGKVRGAKLYYLRGLQGKKARIKEDLEHAAISRAAGLRRIRRRTVFPSWSIESRLCSSSQYGRRKAAVLFFRATPMRSMHALKIRTVDPHQQVQDTDFFEALPA